MPVFGKLRLSGVLWRKRADQMSRFDVLTAWNKFREKQGQAQDARLASVSETLKLLLAPLVGIFSDLNF